MKKIILLLTIFLYTVCLSAQTFTIKFNTNNLRLNNKNISSALNRYNDNYNKEGSISIVFSKDESPKVKISPIKINYKLNISSSQIEESSNK